MNKESNYDILTNVPIAYAVFENISSSKDCPDYKIVFMNALFKNMFPEALKSHRANMTLCKCLEMHLKSCDEFLCNLKEVFETSKPVDFYHYFEQTQRYVHFIISKHQNGNLVLYALDESEKIRTELLENELKDQHILLRTALDSIPDMVAIKNVNGKYLIANKAVNNYYKSRFDSIEGKTIDEIYPKKEADIVKKLDMMTIKKKKSIRKKVRIYTDNDFIVTDLARAPIYNNNNQLIGIISVGKDITKQEKARKELLKTKQELKELLEKYKHLAYHDDLTKVYNRRKFYEHLKSLDFITTNVLILTDLSNFKLVNDTKGHLFGDNTLKNIAQYLVDLFKDYNGKVYRLGGDEFGIIYSHENVNVIEENISALDKYLQEFHPKLSISYGKKIINNEQTMDQVNIDLEIKRVDRLLYDYKEKSKQ